MLRLFNTLTGKVEQFCPSGKVVKIFSCGPTVYARVHLGHGKSYVSADLVRRMLAIEGHATRHVVNYTDVSDETARKSAAKGLTELQLAQRCEKAFERDMELLNILPPDLRPRVSEHIPEIIAVTESLVARRLAYVIDEGVYLRARKEDFGSLLRRPLDDALVPCQKEGTGGKESPLDFALWERSPPGRLSWESPWGRGRPGWHVQDFAFIQKHLGLPIDIYTGGIDLVFPHHESEMRMAQAVTGGPISRFWMHNGHVTFEGEKLSKSKGVRVELSSLFRKYGGEAVRFFLLQSHYREQTHYTEEAMRESVARFARIRDAWRSLKTDDGAPSPSSSGRAPLKSADEIVQRIRTHMGNDLRTDMAVEELEALAGLTMARRESWTAAERESARAAWAEASKMLGILDDYPERLRSESPGDDCDC